MAMQMRKPTDRLNINLGLRLEKIHPLERDAYRQLLADLARKPPGR